MNNHNTCFGYTRVSTVKQGEGVSLEAQKEAIQAFADKNQLHISRWFEEKETAAKSGRPVFSAMIKELHKGKASNLIIHKIDRSARNLADWAKIGELSDAGINVHFATESLDFRSRGGRLTADIQAVIAADYIRNLREETIKGINGRLKQGLYPWKAPIGYLDNGGGKVKTLDPVRAPLVKRIFDCYATNEYSLWMLTDEAKRIGLRNDKGKNIGKTCIENMLSNPFYIGLMHIPSWNQTFEGIHKPLISVSLFKKVEKIRAGKWVKKSTKHNHTFRRLFKCAKCNRAIIGESQKSWIYYRCHTKGCKGKAIREESIDQYISQTLRNLELPTIASLSIDLFVSELPCQNLDYVSADTTEMQIAKLDERKTALLNAYLDGVIDKETYEQRHQEMLFLVSELREKHENKLNPEELKQHLLKISELFKSLYFTYSFANPAEKRQIIEKVYANRLINDGKLMIEPRNWVIEASKILAFRFGPPARSTKRSRQEFEALATELLALVSQPEIIQLQSMVLEINTKFESHENNL